jgi:anti-sigma-K factor RskA
MRDDEMFDAVAALALGVLPEDEAREVRSAIERDDALRAEYRALRAAADLIGYGAESPAGAIDQLQAARMKARIMKAVGAGGTETARRSRALVWPAWAAAAAAVVIAIVSTLSSLSLRSDLNASRARVAALETQAAANSKDAQDARAELADLLAPDAKRYAVNAGEVISRGNRIYLAMTGLPKLPPGKVFQAWTLATGEKSVAPSVTFTATSNGTVLVALPPQQRHIAAVAVSVEPAGGSKAPTSKPVFVRALS